MLSIMRLVYNNNIDNLNMKKKKLFVLLLIYLVLIKNM